MAGLTAQTAPAYEGKTAAEWSAAIQKAPDAVARQKLVEKLGRASEKAQPVLLALLDDPNPAVKMFAADSLVVSGWTAIPALDAKGHERLVERKPTESDLVWLDWRTRAASPEDGIACDYLARFVDSIGDKRFLPWLERIIRGTVSGNQTRLASAINAYARLTGVDFRPKEFTWKQAHEVRLKYLEHFKKVGGDA